MATRALVDACVDDFWRTAKACPTTHEDQTRNQASRSAALSKGSKSARASSLGKGCRSARGTGGILQCARPSQPDPEGAAEFRNITIELRGREGFNALAVNGIWRFWRVRNGRLAFRRDVEIPVELDDLEEEGYSDANHAADTEAVASGGRQLAEAIRLYLFYSQQVDTWLISDSPDSCGSVTADCGPVCGSGQDLQQHWRVWDGEAWRQDRNIHAEVALGGLGFPNLKGLQIVQPASKHCQRAQSQEPRSNTQLPDLFEARPPPDALKPLCSARPRRQNLR